MPYQSFSAHTDAVSEGQVLHWTQQDQQANANYLKQVTSSLAQVLSSNALTQVGGEPGVRGVPGLPGPPRANLHANPHLVLAGPSVLQLSV